MFKQDSDINSWTGGNLASNGQDVAKFFWNLLGPGNKILSDASLINMMYWRPLSKGWRAYRIEYGAGLMI
jgi:hypothetical protein